MMINRLLVALLFVTVLSYSLAASAQARRAHNTGNNSINTATANVIHEKGTARGFAANDSRYESMWGFLTQAANDAVFGNPLGTAAGTAAAVGSVALVAGAPVWATVLIAAGVGAVTIGGIYLVGKYLIETDTEQDGAMRIKAADTAATPTPPGNIQTNLQQGSASSWFNWAPSNIAAPSSPSCFAHSGGDTFNVQYRRNDFGTTNPGVFTARLPSNDDYISAICVGDIDKYVEFGNLAFAWQLEIAAGITFSQVKSCEKLGQFQLLCELQHPEIALPIDPGNKIYADSISFIITLNGLHRQHKSMTDLMVGNSYFEQQIDQKVDPKIIADTANAIWQRAAALPGYNGIPYDASNPITANDVSSHFQRNPGLVPSVRDLFSAPDPSGATQSIPIRPSTYNNPSNQPVTPPAPSPTPTPSEHPAHCGAAGQQPCKIDFGPQVPPPSDPTSRTETEIRNLLTIQPLDNLKTGIVFPTGAACPVFTIPFKLAFGTVVRDQNMELNAHCELAENSRAAISAMMLLVFVLAATFIILSA